MWIKQDYKRNDTRILVGILSELYKKNLLCRFPDLRNGYYSSSHQETVDECCIVCRLMELLWALSRVNAFPLLLFVPL